MIEAGDYVFTKQLILSPKPGGTKMTLKGHAICLLLGNLQPKQDPPSVKDCNMMAAAAGWTTFDEVGELLGKAAMDEMILKLAERYAQPKGEKSENDKK